MANLRCGKTMAVTYHGLRLLASSRRTSDEAHDGTISRVAVTEFHKETVNEAPAEQASPKQTTPDDDFDHDGSISGLSSKLRLLV